MSGSCEGGIIVFSSGRNKKENQQAKLCFELAIGSQGLKLSRLQWGMPCCHALLCSGGLFSKGFDSLQSALKLHLLHSHAMTMGTQKGRIAAMYVLPISRLPTTRLPEKLDKPESGTRQCICPQPQLTPTKQVIGKRKPMLFEDIGVNV